VASFLAASSSRHRDGDHGAADHYIRPHARRRLTYEAVKVAGRRLPQPLAELDHRGAVVGLPAGGERTGCAGPPGRRVLTSLVGARASHALALERRAGGPTRRRVWARYQEWLGAQERRAGPFTPAQRWWLDRIAEHDRRQLANRAG